MARKRPPPNPDSNMLYGIEEIATFIRRCPRTTKKYIKYEGLPAAKLPGGIWVTHKALILQWIIAGHDAAINSDQMLEPGWFEKVRKALMTTAEHAEADISNKHRLAARLAGGEDASH